MDLRSTVSALPRWQKWALAAAIVILLYAIFGFWIAPKIVHAQAEKAIQESTGRTARIGDVRINPFLLTLTVRDFDLPDSDGSPFVRFEELGVDFELSSIFRRAFTFAEIRIVAPFAHVKVLTDGSLNAAGLLVADDAEDEATPAEQEEDSGPPPILVGLASIERGRIVFSDYSHATVFEHEVAPLDVELRDFGTRPDDESPYSFSATTGAGEALEWEGNLSVVPLYSSGRFALTGAQPRTGWLYVQDNVHFEVIDGAIDIRGRYDLDSRDGLRVDLHEGEIVVRNFAVAERETGDVAVKVPEFDIGGISIAYPEQHVHVDSVTSSGGHYKLLRFPDGTFRAELLARTRSEDGAEAARAAEDSPPAEHSATSVGDEETASWSVAVDRIDLTGHHLELEDRSTEPPVLVGIDIIGLGLRDVTTDPAQPIQTTLELGIGERGRITVEGPVRAEPAQVELELKVADIDLRPFEPYWAPALAIDVSSGRIGLEGRLLARGEGGDTPQVEYTGSFRVDDLRTLDKLVSSDLFSWSALELDGIALAIAPTSFRLKQLTLQRPAAHVVIAPDGTANLATLVVEPAPEPDAERPADGAQTAPSAAAGEPIPISVGIVQIVNGTVDFEDRTISPRFKTGVSALKGRIEGLSSDPQARATVALAGQLDGATPMRIDGVVSPLATERYVDVRLAFENFGLTPLTPYSGRYVGKAIERGKLFVDLSYELNGTKLTGENKVFLDQFTLGQGIDSPDATDLPVGLALALLKDREGEIHIDLPISGDVDDPDFSIGGIVLGALRNLITKVAMSPFAMLGGLGGSGGESMSSVAFAPGSATLEPSEVSKLDTLAKGLAERPALSVELAGQATVEIDRPALQATRLENALRRVRFQELSSKWFGDKPTSVDEVVLTTDDRRRLTADAFEARFDQDPDDLLAVRADMPVGEDATPPTPDEIKAAREAEMSRRLRDAIEIDEVALRDLARQRAESIRDHLVATAGVQAARVYVLDPDLHETTADGAAGATLSLAAH